MIHKQFYKIMILIILFNIYPINLSSFEVKVLEKINNQIITNVDVENEYKYLSALNVKYKELDKQKMLEFAKASLIKEIIKRNELEKYYDFTENNTVVVDFVKNLYLGLGFKDEEEFKIYLKPYDVDIKIIYEKIIIENAWNQLIYTKYKDQVVINKTKIKKELSLKKNEVIKYNISEIFFSAKTIEEYKNKISKIKKNINNDGFENTALLYSESGSAKNSGSLGWVNENQLSKVFIKELIALKVGENTKPIDIPGGKLILKINDIRKELKEIDVEKELNDILIYERNRQLNNFSIIYYNKVKNKITDVKN
jgi:peptidyl-prolyl cis-trans isomerase SurA